MKLIFNKIFKITLSFFMLGFSTSLFSQTLTQVVRGKIYDSESQVALPYANVVIAGTDPLLGTVSDINGVFKIPDVPIGRYNIQISYLGYEQTVIPEVLITTGKETVLNIELKQLVKQIDEVTVNGYSRKDKPLNSMAVISARSFTVEETRRYAGGLDDPARMASAFAGVTVGNIQDNAIIIRGNSPKGVSWRLEGVEIPNPNHFQGGNVAGGGAVTIFSSQLLSNSDFFTGAFPAEYGNALAGVFDMKLRNGNDETRENTLQAGVLGIDVASEGPFKKGKQATYLFNYRYSTFGLLSNLGIIPSQQVPKYQDLSFKLNFPAQRAGTFSLWGIGGIDNNKEPESTDSATWETGWDRIHYDWSLIMGATGLTHKITLNSLTFLNTTIAASGTKNVFNQKRLDNNLVLRPDAYLVDKSGRLTFSSRITHKFNTKYTLKAGLDYQALFYNLDMSSTTDENKPDTYRNFVKGKGNSSYTEFFAESKYDVSDMLSINGGINANYFALNRDFSIDPRFGIKWEFTPHHFFSFGYGKHSQLEELKIYFISKNADDKIEYPNKNLGLAHAQHFIFGYDWLINNHLRLKVEPYYQYLYNVPGIRDSSYSMINFKQDWTFGDSLVNNSTGRNIGIDFTLERFLYHNFYYLLTASVFNSKYKGGDDVWRNTRYNKGYVLNILLGKEFFIKKNRMLGVNARLNYVGGERYSPVLMAESLQEREVVFDESKAFEAKESPMYYLDFTITYRRNKKRYSGVWALQIKNVLGSPNYEGFEYNLKTHTIEKDETVVIVPVLSYKIEF